MEQGLLADASAKARPIDDLIASGVNAHTHPTQKVTNDTLDKLLEAMRRVRGALQVRSRLPSQRASRVLSAFRLKDEMALYKADIDSAYRRVPILPGRSCPRAWLALLCTSLPGHRKFAAVVYKLSGKIYMAQHAALPFGAAAAVQGWHRIGPFS